MISRPMASHPYGSACTSRIVLALIETGRPGKAVPLLERLPDLIAEELGRAYARGHDAAVTAAQGEITRRRAELLRRLDVRIARACRELDGLEGKRSPNARPAVSGP